MASLQVNDLQGLKSGPGGKPRAPIAPPKLTTLFSRVGAPPAFEVREDRCETTDMASGVAAYVRSSGVGGMVTGAVFTGAGLFFIYLRWKEDRK